MDFLQMLSDVFSIALWHHYALVLRTLVCIWAQQYVVKRAQQIETSSQQLH